MNTQSVVIETVSKRFGSTQALQDFSMTAYTGMVHAIVGENGAGKSTLIKILSGVFPADNGRIILHGTPVQFSNPLDAKRAGVATIFQELTLLPNLSIIENLFLGQGLTYEKMRAKTEHLMAQLELDLDPDRPILSLSIGEQQLIEIAKGLNNDAHVFIFDEPTAALADNEVKKLFDLIHTLKQDNKTVIYISHRFSEIFALSDTITILKDGGLVDTVQTRNTTHGGLIEKMVGRPIEQLFPPKNPSTSASVLSVVGLTSPQSPHAISLQVARGEIVGIAGLEGQGQSQIMKMIMGFDTNTAGTIQVGDTNLSNTKIQHRINNGLGFIPENRKDDGLFPSLDIFANLLSGKSIQSSMLSWFSGHHKACNQVIKDLAIKTVSGDANVMSLSGGNQQKVVLGRWLIARIKVLLCEEPTRGVDIGTKVEIYKQLRHFSNQGNGVLITSREMPELIRIVRQNFGCQRSKNRCRSASAGYERRIYHGFSNP